MFNEKKILDTVSSSISNCIYNVYGPVGYFTGIEGTTFGVDIYDLPSKKIVKMSDEEAKKHLLKSIEVEFKETFDHLADLGAIDYIVTEIEKEVYGVGAE